MFILNVFDRAIPEKRTEELCIDALTQAAGLIDKTPAELKGYIHSCYYGHFADHFGDQHLGEAVIHDRLGLDSLGNIGIKTGGDRRLCLVGSVKGRGIGVFGLCAGHGLGTHGRGTYG